MLLHQTKTYLSWTWSQVTSPSDKCFSTRLYWWWYLY